MWHWSAACPGEEQAVTRYQPSTLPEGLDRGGRPRARGRKEVRSLEPSSAGDWGVLKTHGAVRENKCRNERCQQAGFFIVGFCVQKLTRSDDRWTGPVEAVRPSPAIGLAWPSRYEFARRAWSPAFRSSSTPIEFHLMATALCAHIVSERPTTTPTCRSRVRAIRTVNPSR